MRRRPDDGVTLIELMVTVMIVGIAFGTILVALQGMYRASDEHRKLSVAETWVRRYADAIGAASYTSCASTSTYSAALTPSPPADYTATIASVEYWNGDTSPATFGSLQSACQSSGDKGAQRITVRVAGTLTSGSVTKTVVFVKRNPS
jgi:prepilin-type N-terminal cleavage/methylation domain-containing protein